jgi:hypothetical protein
MTRTRLNTAAYNGTFYVSGPVYALQQFCEAAGVPENWIRWKERRDEEGLGAKGYLRLRGRPKRKAKLALQEGFRYDAV